MEKPYWMQNYTRWKKRIQAKSVESVKQAIWKEVARMNFLQHSIGVT